MLIDSSTWKEYSKMDAELEASKLLPNLPPSKSFEDYSSALELRQSFNEQIAQLVAAGIVSLPDWTGYHRSEIYIRTRDGAPLRSLVYRPEGKEAGPLYGPEHVFPTAAHDAIDAVKWCGENAASLGANPSKGFTVGGTSAGGNLAAVAAHQVVDDNLSPKVTGVVLLSAPLCHREAMPEEYKPHISSWEDHKDGLVLSRQAIEWFYDNYKPDPMSPLMSPLIWKTHKGQPATYLQVMGLLQDAGTPTKMEVYTGLPHGAPDFFPMHSVSKKALVDLKEGIGWILQQSSG
ncbi:hypothetical protein J4E90_001048 [Alternaria incomplexa]|uniref:uncharacterized protein n=1 Tax=Alternaria incomplexa TaxID=1187928 RepID=UPI00221F8466|nr:uncharacterized protein J4E90_001048 [Alternaria incomplexa]KAI4922615.1 hypothetical protein J4E90_001048 [Alternaria incomplexa]